MQVSQINNTKFQGRFQKTPALERIMKENLNMRGFNSLRAWYLFDKGEKFEEKARKLEAMGKDGDDYKEAACFCRCDADEAEAEYNAEKRRKNKR